MAALAVTTGGAAPVVSTTCVGETNETGVCWEGLYGVMETMDDVVAGVGRNRGFGMASDEMGVTGDTTTAAGVGRQGCSAPAGNPGSVVC